MMFIAIINVNDNVTWAVLTARAPKFRLRVEAGDAPDVGDVDVSDGAVAAASVAAPLPDPDAAVRIGDPDFIDLTALSTTMRAM